MDSFFHGMVMVIWMSLTTTTLGNCVSYKLKGLVNDGFYEWTSHTVLFCAFVMIDCVKEKTYTTHILCGT